LAVGVVLFSIVAHVVLADFWNFPQNVCWFMQWAQISLSIQHWTDWYNVHTSQVAQIGGYIGILH
jgi:hypothetical protein